MPTATSEPAIGHQSWAGTIPYIVPEILSSILQFARYLSRRSEFISCLLVCRLWYNLGLPYAWSSICLNNDSLELFIRVNQSSQCCHQIRSLTLKLNAIWPTNEEQRIWLEEKIVDQYNGANPGTFRLWKNLEALADIIRFSMLRLVSFSLCMDRYPLGGRLPAHMNEAWGAWLRTGTIAKLLVALPVCCIDLELDTRGRDDDPACRFRRVYGSTHLCSVIRGLFPRLRHLRLRLGALCSHLIFALSGDDLKAAEAPHLVSMSINLNLDPYSEGVADCMGSGQKSGDIDTNISPPLSGIGWLSTPYRNGLPPPSPRYLQLGLRKLLQEAHEAGKFPGAETLQVTNTLGSVRVRNYLYAVQDIAKGKTHILPFRLLWKQDGAWDDHTFVGRNKADEEFFGIMTEIEPLMEEGEWVTTSDGDRWAKDFKNNRSHRLATLRKPRYETRKEFLDRCESRFEQWSIDGWRCAKDLHSEIKECWYV